MLILSGLLIALSNSIKHFNANPGPYMALPINQYPPAPVQQIAVAQECCDGPEIAYLPAPPAPLTFTVTRTINLTPNTVSRTVSVTTTSTIYHPILSITTTKEIQFVTTHLTATKTVTETVVYQEPPPMVVQPPPLVYRQHPPAPFQKGNFIKKAKKMFYD